MSAKVREVLDRVSAELDQIRSGKVRARVVTVSYGPMHQSIRVVSALSEEFRKVHKK